MRDSVDKPRTHGNPPRDLQESLARHIKHLRHWVVWKWEKNEQGKWTKPPFIATSLNKAKNNDRTTWRNYEQACTAVENDEADGIGFNLLGTNVAAFDIDNCRDPETGELHPYAIDLVRRANSYTEITPSGTGLRIIGTASDRYLHRKLTGPQVSVEFYRNCERYITISNAPLEGVTTELNDIDALLDTELDKLDGQKRPGTTTPQWDDSIIEESKLVELNLIEPLLDEELLTLIHNGVPKGEQSDQFFHAVGWLKDSKLSVVEIFALLSEYPKGIAKKYSSKSIDKLSKETQRAYHKAHEPDPVSDDDDDDNDDDAKGQVIVSDSNHMKRARKMRDLQRPHLVYYRDDFRDFKAGAYQIIEEGAITAHAWHFLDKAKAKRKDGRGKDAVKKIVPFCPNRNSVGETLAALKAITHLNSYVEAPCWLNGRTDLPPNQIIAFPNGLLDLRNNTLHPVDPKFFTIAALGFDYIAANAAPEPILWLKFLDEIFEGDDKDKQIAALQETFGYLLTVDTSQEKAFLLLGPKRSGKGTMVGMLRKLLASSTVAGPALKSLANTFGLTPLIDKQLAIIDDLRVGSTKDQDILIENVLKITGRGLFTIDRKYKDAWTGCLPVKLMLLSNPMPKLGDDSAALASRFIIFCTRVSFFGHEDPQLLDKLTPELTGIFHWALQGLKRLRERGHFVETATSMEARERLANLGSPARVFIAERCILDPRVFEDKDDMYSEWCTFAQDNNMLPGTKEKFYEALYAAGGGLIQAGRPWVTLKDAKGIPIKDKNGVVKKQLNAVMGICLLPFDSFTEHANESGR
jgi:P4 family phage/plasmid primase-like protien